MVIDNCETVVQAFMETEDEGRGAYSVATTLLRCEAEKLPRQCVESLVRLFLVQEEGRVFIGEVADVLERFDGREVANKVHTLVGNNRLSPLHHAALLRFQSQRGSDAATEILIAKLSDAIRQNAWSPYVAQAIFALTHVERDEVPALFQAAKESSVLRERLGAGTLDMRAYFVSRPAGSALFETVVKFYARQFLPTLPQVLMPPAFFPWEFRRHRGWDRICAFNLDALRRIESVRPAPDIMDLTARVASAMGMYGMNRTLNELLTEWTTDPRPYAKPRNFR